MSTPYLFIYIKFKLQHILINYDRFGSFRSTGGVGHIYVENSNWFVPTFNIAKAQFLHDF